MRSLRRVYRRLPLVVLLACEPRRDADRSAGVAPRGPERGHVVEVADGECRALARDTLAAHRILRACDRAAKGMTRLIGAAAPPGVVIEVADSVLTGALQDADVPRRVEERWAMAVGTDMRGGEPLQLGGGARMSAEGYLAHEIAHRIGYAMLYADTPAESPDDQAPEYGSPLPDWLDEAMSLLVEPEADQAARVAALFEDETILALPLRRFLYMAHPALRGIPPGAPVRRVFYGQSLAFAQFLQQRGGSGALRQLIAALRAGTTQGVALTSLRGLPDDGGLLEQEWLAWLRAQRDRFRANANSP